ncbi:MAG: glycosyltransferase family 39 protein [Janthinobacterium lividum]
MPVAPAIHRLPVFVPRLFFGLLLALGSLLVSDYGVSWDEQIDRQNGLVNLRYIAELVAPAWVARQPQHAHVPRLQTYSEADHGVLFELPLAAFDALRASRNDRRPYYLLRHAAVFVISLGGLWALFRLASLRFRDERLGLLAAGLLVLSPRFFAESFFNGKDIVFMAAFTLGVYTLARLLERPTWPRALGHALATAAATDIRVLGLLLVPFTLGLLTLRCAQGAESRRALVSVGLVYGLAAATGMVAGWPYLWADPLGHLLLAFHNLSHFRWSGQLLYGGQVLPAGQLPWHYAPVWISITTPVAYQVAALLGVAATAGALLRQPRAALRTLAGQLDVLLLGWLALPLALVIGLHSVVYDGWRHLYFVYPALLLFALRGGLAVARWGQLRPGRRWLVQGLGLLAGAEAVLTAGRMVSMHPFEHTYFSYLPRRQAERLFERDYWGLSFRQGLAYVAAHQPKGLLRVAASNPLPLDNNVVWLAPADRARLVVTMFDSATFFITNYRTVSGDYPSSVGQEVYALRADGVKILSVFRRPPVSAAAR